MKLPGLKKLLAMTICVSAGNLLASDFDASSLSYSVITKLDNGTEVRNGGYGSAMTAHPTMPDHFYLLTDRGPNANFTGKEGKGKKFSAPDYTPRIAEVKLNSDGSIHIVRTILLQAPDGRPITGLPNPEGMGSTGEVPYDNHGKVLNLDPYGLDSEGLVAMKDGTFWVSDEYGPHIVHYSAKGVELERINPFGSGTGHRKLPAVFANRRANRGMEGLAITPDEKTLVGIMQSTMFNPSKQEISNKTLTRIVTFDIASGLTKQYLYHQDADNLSNSEIAAINDHEFLVIERDGGFLGDKAEYKRLYRIDLTAATDVNGDFSAPTGLLIGNKTLEQSSWDDLALAGITPVTKELVADVLADLNYPHDKLEGLWVRSAWEIGVINDDDFAVTADKEGTVIQKVLKATNEVDANTLYTFKLNKPLL
ncbi:esterase-like activity of phytase family protein [Hahella ganghwensis]|uniref:esterase-like activity of phytase family protein n=1 Tax=Hahella ganghwensis TaxID=286420 RepID=UPI00037B2647|nr:esterase-like activity of phytase family protein [Hahella ganghwensis]